MHLFNVTRPGGEIDARQLTGQAENAGDVFAAIDELVEDLDAEGRPGPPRENTFE